MNMSSIILTLLKCVHVYLHACVSSVMYNEYYVQYLVIQCFCLCFTLGA